MIIRLGFAKFRQARRWVKFTVVHFLVIYLTLGNFAPVFASTLVEATAETPALPIPQLTKPFNGDYEVTRRFGEKIDSEESKVATASAEPVADSTPEVDAAYTSGVSETQDISAVLAKIEGGGGHNGIDFAMPQGTEILAVDDGEVINAGERDYGITVVIKHSWGESVYGHLSKLTSEESPSGPPSEVSVGKTVSKGQVIALSGSTGLATGPHLHLGIKNSNGEFVDPALYLSLNDQRLTTKAINTSEVGFDSSEVERDTASQILGESSSTNVTFEDVSENPDYLYNYKFSLPNGTSVHFDHKTDPRPGYAIADSNYNYKLRFFLKEAVNSAQNTSEAAQSDSSDGGQRGPTVKDNIVEFPITLLSSTPNQQNTSQESKPFDSTWDKPTSEVRIPATLRYTIYDNRVKEDIILLEKPAIDSSPQNTSEVSFGSSEVDSDNLQISFEVQSAGLEVVNTSTSEESIRPPSGVKTQNTNTVDKNSQYIFKNPDGSVYWQIQKPTVADANGKTGEISGELKDNFYSLTLNTKYLTQAAYPLTIDPTVIINTSSSNTATYPSTMRHIVRTSDATLHAFVQVGTQTATCTVGGSSSGLLWFISTDSGATFTCQQQLSSTTSFYADARVDSSDNIYVVYSSNATGGGATLDVTYQKLTSSNCSPAPCDWTLEAAQTVLDGDGAGDNAGFHFATIELQGTTRAWIAAREYDGTNRQVGVYYSSDLSAAPTWTVSQATLDTADTNTSAHIPILVRFGSNIGVIYNLQLIGDLGWRYRADTDGLTTWNTAATIDMTPFACALSVPTFSAAGATGGNVYVASNCSTDVIFNYWDGSAWLSSASTVSSAAASSAFVSLETNGTSVWVIYGQTTGLTSGLSGSRKLVYKKGVSPFADANFDSSATAVVSYHDIFDKVWVASTDETTDAGDTDTSDVQLGTTGSIYFGKTTTYDVLSWDLSSFGAGGVKTWEYCSAVNASTACTTWSSLTFTVSSAPNFTEDGWAAFTAPSDWVAAKVNTDSSAFYYVRARTTTTYTSGPVGIMMAAIPQINWANAANTTSGIYAIWTENASSPTRVRYATVLTHNIAPDAPSSLGGHVSGAFTADTTPTLTFTLADSDSGDTVKYQIQIDDSSNFGSAVVDYTSALAAQGSTSFTVGQAAGSGSYTTGSAGQTLSDGDYYWRVKAIDDDSAESSYSTANSGSIAFKVDAAAPTTPGTPSTTTPTTDTTPTWTWTASTDSGAGLATTPYTLQWSTDSSFGSGVSSTTAASATFTHSTALTDGTWYFRVKAKDTLGNESSYSSAGSVVIDTTAPSAPELDSPADKAYVNNPRPTFRWKSASGIDSYKIDLDNGDTGDISVDGISSTGTTDVETSRYVIRYDNFSDSDSSNNYISLYTKSSSAWSSSQDDGKLKEGKRSWQVTAYDAVDNNSISSRTIYADYTGPTFENLEVDNIGSKNGYTIVIDTTPDITGTIKDNFAPDKVKISVFAENYFLGTLTSTSFVWEKTIDLKNTTDATKLDFKTTVESLEYGKYQILARGTDKAGNNHEKTISMQLLTEGAARKLLKGEDGKLKKKAKFSLVELEKKAKLRREMEASELRKLIEKLRQMVEPPVSATAQIYQQFKKYLARILPGQIEKLERISASITNSVSKKYSKVKNFADANFAQARDLADSLGFAADDLLETSEENVKRRIDQTQEETKTQARNIVSYIGNALSGATQSLTKSQGNIAQKITQTHQDTSRRLKDTYGAFDLAFQSLAKPLDEAGDFLNRVKVGAYTFHAIVFDKEPTRISDVTIEEIGEDYAVISWKTNHYATGKVNWGKDLTYGNEIVLNDREQYHNARLTGLKKGTRYFFEVMSQNKNYAYDAFYSFEIEDK